MIPGHIQDTVLLAYVQGHSAPSLAAHFNLPLRALSQWLESPEVTSLVDSLRKLAETQAVLASAHARVAAALTLESVIKGAQVSDEVFRASSLVIRNTARTAPARKETAGREAGAESGARRTAPARRSHQASAPGEAPTDEHDTIPPRDTRVQTDGAAQSSATPRSPRTDSPEPRSHDRAREDRHAASPHEPERASP